jgi:uncharacterized metal-binding protein
MKKTFVLLIGLLMLAATFAAAQSNGTNAAPIAGAILAMFGLGIAAFLSVILIIVVLAVLATAFWIWMLIDCAQRESENRVAWILIIVFLHVLGALVYYFVVKRQDKRKTK